MAIPLIKSLLKVWPITNPAKEVVFLNEIEELLDSNWQSINSSNKFNEYGTKLIKRLIKTA